jgi:hypothetical protein
MAADIRHRIAVTALCFLLGLQHHSATNLASQKLFRDLFT